MPKTQGRHYAENPVAPICRKSSGSLTPKDDSSTRPLLEQLELVQTTMYLQIQTLHQQNLAVVDHQRSITPSGQTQRSVPHPHRHKHFGAIGGLQVEPLVP